MRLTSRIALMAALALASLPALATDSNCFNTSRVRAFASDTDGSLIIKEGGRTYRRITVDAACPLAGAERLYFHQGPGTAGTLYTGSRQIPVIRNSLTQRFCASTPAISVVVMDYWGNRQTRCRIQAIEPATREDFQAGKRFDVR